MAVSLPLTYLEKNREPLLMANTDGFVLWANDAARALGSWRGEFTLEKVFDAAAVRTILDSHSYNELKLDLVPGLKASGTRSVTVLEIGSGEPADVTFLIAILPIANSSRLIDEHEEFLATVTHDLKNPLGAIFGYADVLLDTDAGAGLAESHSKIIGRIRHTASRCLELVRNYQQLAQLKSTGLHVSPAPTDLNFIVRFVVDYMWREAPGAPKLDAKLAPHELPIYVERVYIERIVANLLSNAFKYSGETGCVKLSTYREGPFAVLQVTNSGAAIPKKELGDIFQRYARASNALGIPGTGLGLYIVKSIVDAAGGTITVTSSEQEGTCFTLRLPLK